MSADAWSSPSPSTAPNPVTLPEQPPPWLPAPPTESQSRGTWLVVAVVALLTAVAVLAVLVGGLVLLAGDSDDRVGSSAGDANESVGLSDAAVVFEEDFTAGPGPFESFDENGFVGQHGDGAYELTGSTAYRTSWSSATIGPSSVVDITARLELVSGQRAYAGMGLVVQPNAKGAYLLDVLRGGDVTLSKASGELSRVLNSTDGPAVGGATTLRLTVAATASGTELVGYVDGQRVIHQVDEGGWDRFEGAGIAVVTGPEPATVRIDDVVVRAAG
jgi:hypothetical protein